MVCHRAVFSAGRSVQSSLARKVTESFVPYSARCPSPVSQRQNSTALLHRSFASSPKCEDAGTKVSVKLVAELRKRTPVSMQKAREALAASGNDIDGALAWLEKDLIASGAKKAAKLESRTANAGLIACVVLADGSITPNSSASAASLLPSGGLRAGIVELNCETDFVARNELFSKLALDIAHTVAYYAEPPPSIETSHVGPSSHQLIVQSPVDQLQEAVLIPSASLSSVTSPSADSPSRISSVSAAMQEAVARLGEKVSLRRAASVAVATPEAPDFLLRLGPYVHQPLNESPQHLLYARAGLQGSIAILQAETSTALGSASEASSISTGQSLGDLARTAARQIIGLQADSILPAQSPTGHSSNSLEEGVNEESTVLYDQPAIMFGDGSLNVARYLATWSSSHGLQNSVQVVKFIRWKVGEVNHSLAEGDSP